MHVIAGKAVCFAEAVHRSPLLGTEVFPADEIVSLSTGHGTASEGEFSAALHTASTPQLPLALPVQANGYALSVPL